MPVKRHQVFSSFAREYHSQTRILTQHCFSNKKILVGGEIGMAHLPLA